ncbi:MAG TPA: GNAT family N-acetyltransferase [Kofleriaceae bacterium]|nr:GNAT family N-acetyltransferase [Kofleriaceae bacterium]
MNATPQLRPAARHETEALVELAVSTGLFTPDEADLLLRQTLEALHAGTLGADHHAFVAADEPGEPRGWVYFAKRNEPDEPWDLWWIGVAPAHHGTGVGTALLAFVEDFVRARSGRVLYIETSSDDKLAATRAFYRRRGYAEAGQVADFYAQGEDKIVFAKAFEPGAR